jgi:hypothetical protein
MYESDIKKHKKFHQIPNKILSNTTTNRQPLKNVILMLITQLCKNYKMEFAVAFFGSHIFTPDKTLTHTKK